MTPVLAEFAGTFALVLAILYSGGNALIIASAVAVILLSIGSISGGNINPAVSFAMFLKGGLSQTKFLTYVAAQLAAAAAAYYTYRAMQG